MKPPLQAARLRFCRRMADYSTVLSYWPTIESNIKKVGGDVLCCLFNTHPETQKVFPKFASIPPGDLPGNAAVAAHGETVLRKLGEMVHTKGNHEPILKSLSSTHANKHKVTISQFKMLGECIISVCTEKYGMDGATQTAMRNILAAIFSDMDAQYKQLGFQG